MNTLFALGTTHRTGNLEEVAHARIPDGLVPQVLPILLEKLHLSELVYLATCHRTEFYLVYEGDLCPGRLARALGQALVELTDGKTSLPDPTHCLLLQGAPVAEHLFRVSAALDSLMLGESQILGQVKQAFRQAADLGTAKAKLHTLFNQAFRAAKRVRSETKLAERPTSLVSLAERLLRARLAADPRPVAVVGAGEMAAAATSLLRKADKERLLVVFNRSQQRGQALAQQVGGHWRPLELLAQAGPEFSVVVLATSADVPILTPEQAQALAPVFVLDLGLPANANPACGRVAQVELVGQEDLQAESLANRKARAAEVARAEAILREQLEELSVELLEHTLSPVARSLRLTFYQLARQELAEAFTNGHGSLPPEFLHQVAERLAQRLLRAPMKGLRQVAFQHSPEILRTFCAALEPKP